jgi:polyribonucleotide nucleotidyltransferase
MPWPALRLRQHWQFRYSIKEIISEVRVARVDGKYIVNPVRIEFQGRLNFIVAATKKTYDGGRRITGMQ